MSLIPYLFFVLSLTCELGDEDAAEDDAAELDKKALKFISRPRP